MRGALTALVAAGALVGGVGEVPAAANARAVAADSPTRTVITERVGTVHRAVVHGPAPSPSPGHATGPHSIDAPRRAVVTFTVAHKTFPFFGFPSLPAAAGRYYAYYVLGVGFGETLLPDPGSVMHWPAELPLSGGGLLAELRPGVTYRMLIALDRAATVALPFPMHVVSVRQTSFPVRVVNAPIDLKLPAAPAVTGSTADRLGELPLSATAIGIDLTTNPSPVSSSSGDACPTDSGSTKCRGNSHMAFFSDTQEFGGSSPEQVVFGEDYQKPVQAAAVSGNAYHAPIPFESARLFGFSFRAPRPR